MGFMGTAKQYMKTAKQLVDEAIRDVEPVCVEALTREEFTQLTDKLRKAKFKSSGKKQCGMIIFDRGDQRLLINQEWSPTPESYIKPRTKHQTRLVFDRLFR